MTMKKKRGALIAKILNQNSQPQDAHYGQLSENIVMRDVRELVPNVKNATYSTENIEELAAMIQITHNIEPIVLKAGSLVITSGHRRRLAQLYRLEHGMTTNPMVPTIEREMVNDFVEAGITDDDMETLNIVFPNRGTRRNLTPSEEADEIAMVKPIVKKIYDYQKARGEVEGNFRAFFADVLGISSAALQRKESLKNLTESVKSEVDAGKITATAAAELAGLASEEQERVVKNIKEKGEAVTVKAVKEEKERQKKDNMQEVDAIEADGEMDTDDSDFEPDVGDEPEEDLPEIFYMSLKDVEARMLKNRAKMLRDNCRKHIKSDGSMDCEHCCLWKDSWCFVGTGTRPADWNLWPEEENENGENKV